MISIQAPLPIITPLSSLNRRRTPAVVHQDNSDRASGTTEGFASIRIGFNPAFYCSTTLGHSHGSGAQATPLQPTSTLCSIRTTSNIRFPPGNKKKTRGLALVPSADKVASLFEHSVILYRIGQEGVIEIYSRTLRANVQRTQYSLGSHYLATYGIGFYPQFEKLVSCSIASFVLYFTQS